MISAWKRWVDLLDRREAPTALALVRIAVGLTVAGHIGHQWATGTAAWVWVDDAYGGLRSLDPGFLSWFGGLTPRNVQALMALTICGSVLMALGLYTRVATAIVWFGYGFFGDLNTHAGGSYDELLKNTLFCLLLSGCGRALSLDARLYGKTGPVTAWPRWLLIFQLFLMYWNTGLQKLSDSWVPGGRLDALWYILQQPTWQRATIDPAVMLPLYPLTQLMTGLVWLFEQGAPLLLLAYWYRETRTRPGRLRALFNRLDFRSLYLLFGVGMHIGIEAMMEVGPFSLASLSLYFACFSPEEWQRVWQRVRRYSSTSSKVKPSA